MSESERKICYLDNNATTRVAPEVVEAMSPYFTEHWGNPSAAYGFGNRLTKDLDRPVLASVEFAERAYDLTFMRRMVLSRVGIAAGYGTDFVDDAFEVTIAGFRQC